MFGGSDRANPQSHLEKSQKKFLFMVYEMEGVNQRYSGTKYRGEQIFEDTPKIDRTRFIYSKLPVIKNWEDVAELRFFEKYRKCFLGPKSWEAVTKKAREISFSWVRGAKDPQAIRHFTRPTITYGVYEGHYRPQEALYLLKNILKGEEIYKNWFCF